MGFPKKKEIVLPVLQHSDHEEVVILGDASEDESDAESRSKLQTGAESPEPRKALHIETHDQNAAYSVESMMRTPKPAEYTMSAHQSTVREDSDSELPVGTSQEKTAQKS